MSEQNAFDSFLGRLRESSDFPQTKAVFLQRLAQDSREVLSREKLFARLYRLMLEFFLREFRQGLGPGSQYREWKPLFGMFEALDPYYHTREDIAQRLSACPPLRTAHALQLQEGIENFFWLYRQGVFGHLTPPLVSAGESRAWAEVFPPALAWGGLEVLLAAGLYPLGSFGSFRVWQRFYGSEKPPPEPREALRHWQKLCLEAQGGVGAALGAHFCDFLVGAHAGLWQGLGLEGPCQTQAQCLKCSEMTTCAFSSNASERLDEEKSVESWSIAKLLQSVFAVAPERAPALEALGARHSLRALGAMFAQEREEALLDTGVDPQRLQALFVLWEHYYAEKLEPKTYLPNGESVFRYFNLKLRDEKQEQFYVLLLNSKKQVFAEHLIGLGTLDQCVVHARDVFSVALRRQAAAIIGVHNHPSGDLTPSQKDLELTREFRKIGNLLHIPFLDHVIVADNRYLSLLEGDLFRAWEPP